MNKTLPTSSRVPAFARVARRAQERMSGCGPAAKLLFAVAAAIPLLTIPGPATAQANEPRVVIASNVACRAEPDVSSPSAVRLDVGAVVWARDRHEGDDGTWYFERSWTYGGCWVFGDLTADWSDREGALVAAADRILARTDRMPLAEVLWVDNFLLQTSLQDNAEPRMIDSSPLVQLRRLQVLARASSAPDIGAEHVRRDPMKSAWIFANRDMLSPNPFGGRWVVTAATLWQLHERHRETEWAEEIAWAAARGSLVRDECDGPCVLAGFHETLARYWREYPDGRWIPDALERAVVLGEGAVRVGCIWSDPEQAPEVAEEIRDTLRPVSHPGKEEVLAQLAALEEVCATG